ncbi:PREDICTED: uncharacterized protein LOC109348272 isoform X3 [Lupinus angustifolius]|uniref:uncharacterized protein LOC109348272 isoform X3 n=1 Tax=Lupinus angustifolius TaxID=3871 RepID=UPI00092E9005|nr:PREDICTED: uncharacterized protein LOC109348272 isoform X3 [Lupinus angustifolius]
MSYSDSISSFCNSLASFCNHLHSSTNALNQSIHRRSIPLDSASSTFLQCLNRRISVANTDLEMLDSMSFGTVSFEELLGHCNELYKKHNNDLVEIEERLKSFGYVPVADVDDVEEEEDEEDGAEGIEFETLCSFYESLSAAASSFNKSFEEEEALFDESLSLKKLGLSDACLATLASEDSSSDASGLSSQEPKNGQEFKHQYLPTGDKMVAYDERNFLSYDNKNLESAKSPSSVLKILESEFESLPGYIRGLASWEELLVAVDKINSSLSKTNGNSFLQDEVFSFDLGPRARSFLLLLVRMKRLAVESVGDDILYRIV